MLPDDEEEGDDDEKERGEKGDSALLNREHPVGGVLGCEKDENHRERYPPLRESEPRPIHLISHFVDDNGEEKEWDYRKKIYPDASKNKWTIINRSSFHKEIAYLIITNVVPDN